MEESLGTNELFEFLEADFKEDDRRKDVMPPLIPCAIRSYFFSLFIIGGVRLLCS